MNLLNDIELNLNDLSGAHCEELAIWLTNCHPDFGLQMSDVPIFLAEDDARILWAIGSGERSAALARLWAYICNPLPF
jgi:hypothetical protein